MKSQLLDLLESSSLPGVPILIKSKQLIVKIVWLLFILLFTALSIYYVIESIHTYYNFDVVTNIHVISEQALPFPAVSFCMIFNRSNTKPTISDVIKFSSFEKKEFHSSDFEIFFFPDPFNLTCFRFNSGKNVFNQSTSVINSIKKGIESGLEVVFDTSTLKSLNIFESKIYVYVDDASYLFLPERPYYNRQDNLNILAKGGNLIKIEREYIQRLSEPHNHCVRKKTTDFISDIFQYFIHSNKTYLQNDCIDLCVWKRLKKKCNCTLAI